MSGLSYDIGIDIGGTFTDVVARASDGSTHLTKVPSTRGDPGAAVRSVLRDVLPGWGIPPGSVRRFVHGTTVATNAVLERKGARTGILTTEGFTDVLEIGRQNRRQIYDLVLRPETPVFLAPGARRKGVTESIAPDGSVRTPLDIDSLERAVQALRGEDVQALAICFLFSFANPEHEQRAARHIREHHPDLVVSLSSEVDPAFREYERSCVTAFDAYVKPGLDRYLHAMEDDLLSAGVRAPLQIMQSRGGVCASAIARRRPVRLFLSGPAAGVIGACDAGHEVGLHNLVSVDIGGTSSDIALIQDSNPIIRPEGRLDTFLIRVPMVDVNSIGSGGGSIAWLDRAGSLRVGPESAGAEPGPAAYARGGTAPTVTDASIVLGYLNPDYFAGGSLRLDAELARRAVQDHVATPLGMTVEQAALGIHRVANAQMAEAIRLVSISRGIDPRGFTLVALGGAGPLHATALASELHMRSVLVPRHPGVLSAGGLLAAPIEHEISAAFPQSLDGLDLTEVRNTLDRLDADAEQLMSGEQVAAGSVARTYFADVCYIGQAHFIEVALHLDDAAPLHRLYEDYCAAHERLYGHHTRVPARIVNLRVVHRADIQMGERVNGEPLGSDAATARKSLRKVLIAGSSSYVDAQVYDREALGPGQQVRGPALCEQSDTTVLIDPGWCARVAQGGNLVLQLED